MGLENINWIGSIVAAAIAFGLGALWYSPALFAGAWMEGFGFTEEHAANSSMARTFGGAFALILLAGLAFSKFLGPNPSFQAGVCWGLLAGVLFASTFMGVHYLFERRPLKLWLINGGYNTACFVIFGVVLGLWP